MQVLYDKSLEEPPPADRLRAMIAALADGAKINAAMRTEIIDALKRHEVRRANDKLRSKRGRSIASTWEAAAIAKELIDKRGASSRKAFIAAAKSLRWHSGFDPASVTKKDEANVKKHYEKLNASADGFIELSDGSSFSVSINDAWLEDAAARLKGSSNIGSGAALDGSAHSIIVIRTR